MIEIVKFEAKHWFDIEEQEATVHLRPLFTRDQIATVAQQEHSYSALQDGRLVACGGVMPYWEGRGEAWAVLAKVCRKEFLEIHNTIKRFLDVCPFERVEITVECDFEKAIRWAELLGFELEAPRMRNYAPDGKDYALYARVR